MRSNSLWSIQSKSSPPKVSKISSESLPKVDWSKCELKSVDIRQNTSSAGGRVFKAHENSIVDLSFC